MKKRIEKLPNPFMYSPSISSRGGRKLIEIKDDPYTLKLNEIIDVLNKIQSREEEE